MAEDPRCCGSGTCIIDTEGRCWCGQQWDGEKMCAPALALPTESGTEATTEAHAGAVGASPGQPSAATGGTPWAR